MKAQRFDNTDGRLRGRALQSRRLRVWTRNPYCARCNHLTEYGAPGQVTHPFQLDHRVPLHKGGPDTDSNCQVLCVPCHDRKTNQDLNRRDTVAIGPDGFPVK